MAYSLKEIEYLHDRGLMPDWIYYQQNGKTAQENYTLQKKRQQEEYRHRLMEERRRKEEEKLLEAEIEKKAGVAIEKALEELLKGFTQ